MSPLPEPTERHTHPAAHWWQPASALAAVLLVVGLFIGGAQPVAVGLVAPPWDKVLHAGVFGVLAVLLAVALRGAHLLHGRKAIGVSQALLWAALLAVMVGGADEIHQLQLPGRMAGWDDWLADATGVALALGGLRWFWQPVRT
jgi:VanZ family protein